MEFVKQLGVLIGRHCHLAARDFGSPLQGPDEFLQPLSFRISETRNSALRSPHDGGSVSMLMGYRPFWPLHLTTPLCVAALLFAIEGAA